MNQCDELLEVFQNSSYRDARIDVIFARIDHDDPGFVLKDEAVDKINGIRQLRPAESHVDDRDAVEVPGERFPVFDT